jgi:hypothetical protein
MAKISQIQSAAFGVLLLPVLATGAHAHGTQVSGASAALETGTIVSWAEMGDDGTLVATGFTVPMSVVEALTANEGNPMGTVLAKLDFPQEAKDATVLDHISFDWMPYGHPPGRYETAHFDIHFYFSDQETIAAIDCSDPTLPSAELIPAGYVLPPADDPHLCVPAMGTHAVPLEDLQSETPFNRVMILGFYGGEQNFVEPMVTQVQLVAREDFSLPIPAVPNGRQGTQPSVVTFEYQADDDSYRVALSGFGQHQ